ncbi:glycosyl hydrolase-related protein [Devosia algicola]|uniref:glycosyl hydrolase-related protein n=1 Tax=Devosia algicola TaxID=3026418 RepID=UPI0038993EB5
MRLQNLSSKPASPTLTFAQRPAGARAADPLEHPGDPLPLDGKALSVTLKPREIRTILVRFAS